MGESAVTERTSFSRPSSSASSPPREFPATWGRSTPIASQKLPSSGATVVRSYATSSGNPGEAPKPGRSTAMTSRSRARTGITGSQACRWWPMPWSSSRGSPEPDRSYATDTVRGPRGDSTVNETVVAMELLPGEATRGVRAKRLRHSVSNNYRQVACSSRGRVREPDMWAGRRAGFAATGRPIARIPDGCTGWSRPICVYRP